MGDKSRHKKVDDVRVNIKLLLHLLNEFSMRIKLVQP